MFWPWRPFRARSRESSSRVCYRGSCSQCWLQSLRRLSLNLLSTRNIPRPVSEPDSKMYSFPVSSVTPLVSVTIIIIKPNLKSRAVRTVPVPKSVSSQVPIPPFLPSVFPSYGQPWTFCLVRFPPASPFPLCFLAALEFLVLFPPAPPNWSLLVPFCPMWTPGGRWGEGTVRILPSMSCPFCHCLMCLCLFCA